jgi:hypothetical protein
MTYCLPGGWLRIIDFTTRQALQQALEQRSGGRLHLDPLLS